MTHRRPTAFAARVYAIVRRIPQGETRSYQWVAERLGNPALARAVGQALHRNPWPFVLNPPTRQPTSFPTLVPCHRVIRADGTLGGYAGGAVKKRRLLRREGATDLVNSA